MLFYEKLQSIVGKSKGTEAREPGLTIPYGTSSLATSNKLLSLLVQQSQFFFLWNEVENNITKFICVAVGFVESLYVGIANKEVIDTHIAIMIWQKPENLNLNCAMKHRKTNAPLLRIRE